MSPPVLKLVIRFQGLCCFLRNQVSLEGTTEATAVLVAAQDAGDDLCPHGPALVFQASDFKSVDGTPTYFTVLNPTAAPTRPALGVWQLQGLDLSVVGAAPASLRIDPSFAQTPDLGQLTGGNGTASPECISAEPPPSRLIAARVSLTSGVLSSTAVAGTGGDDDRWVFADANTPPAEGDPIIFAQEIEYRFYGDPIPASVSIAARPIGKAGPAEILTLSTNDGPATVAISMLCPIALSNVTKEMDFIAYYHLLANPPAHQPIPQRLPDASGTIPVRLGMASCPPGTTNL